MVDMAAASRSTYELKARDACAFPVVLGFEVLEDDFPCVHPKPCRAEVVEDASVVLVAAVFQSREVAQHAFDLPRIDCRVHRSLRNIVGLYTE